MAIKCLTNGYWIVFTISAELIYEIRNWEEGLIYTVIRGCTVPGQCRSKGVDGGAGRGWLCMCRLIVSF